MPTSTGATAAGSVRGRAAISQIRRLEPRSLLWGSAGSPGSAGGYGRLGNFEKSGLRLAL